MVMNHRLLRPLATGFNPKSVSGLVAWYDANVASSITISTGVSNWANLEGTAARDLKQSTGNNQPTVVTDFNGKSAIDFNGTSHFLQRAFSYSNPCHEFVVARADSLGRINALTDGATFGAKLLYVANASNQLAIYQGANLGANAESVIGADPFLADSEFANVSSVGRLNGATYVTGNAGPNIPGGMTVGKWGGTLTVYGDVSVAEILLYGRILSIAEAAMVRRYLAGKYGITLA